MLSKKWRSVFRGEPYGKQKEKKIEQISLGAGD